MDRDTDTRIRLAAIQRLEELKRVHGDVLSRNRTEGRVSVREAASSR